MIAQSRFRSKRFGIPFVLLFLLWGWHWCYHNKTIGFSVAKIRSDFSYHPEWDSNELAQDKLDEIFSQPFHYLGAGSQTYAFVGEDGKTVIKFFRMKHRLFYLRDLWAPHRSDARRENLYSIFEAHQLAYQEMKEDAGLIYLHLNKTHHLKKKIKVIDRLHRTHLIDLDGVEFVLQKNAELIFSRFKTLLERNDRDALNDAISQVMQLVERRMQKGIADHDKAVSHNFGFIGDQAVQIDIGRIYYGEKPKDRQRILDRIDRWLEKQHT